MRVQCCVHTVMNAPFILHGPPACLGSEADLHGRIFRGEGCKQTRIAAKTYVKSGALKPYLFQSALSPRMYEIKLPN